jgi:hypothetical protein
VLLAVGGAIAGIALTTTPRQQARTTQDTHDVIPVAVDYGGSGQVEFFSRVSGGARTLAHTLAVFDDPARPGDALPAVERQIFAMPGSPITPEPGRARRLFSSGMPEVSRGQVWGLMDNGADAVDVRVPASGWLHAALGRNAFYLRLPPEVLAPSEIVVRERNGIRHFYRIERCHLGQITPLTGAAPLGPPSC